MKYRSFIVFTLSIQKATSKLVYRLDVSEFKAKSSGMIFALSLTEHDK